MQNCLIVTPLAERFAAEIDRLCGRKTGVTACSSAEDAVERYAGQPVLLGSPAMLAEVLPHLDGVEWVQSTWAGVTPLIALDKRDYLLTGVRGLFGPQMSEYVFGHILAREIRLLERRAAQRARKWQAALSGSCRGKRLGILGTGSIGRHIAMTGAHFGMVVSGFSRSGRLTPHFEAVHSGADLGTFLSALDYLVCTLPDTSETERLLDDSQLRNLPAHALLINVGRSNVIDDDALIDALYSQRLAGAVLDVFDTEPLPPDSRLWDTPNLSVTAHVAAASHPELIVPLFLDNYSRYERDEPLQHLVDFELGY